MNAPAWMKSAPVTTEQKFDNFEDFAEACRGHGGEQSGHPACNVNNYRFDLRAPEDKENDPPAAKAWLKEHQTAISHADKPQSGICFYDDCDKAMLVEMANAQGIDAYTIPTGCCPNASYPDCTVCGKNFAGLEGDGND